MDHSNFILKIKKEAVPEVVIGENGLNGSTSRGKVLIEAEAVVPETLALPTASINSILNFAVVGRVGDDILTFHYFHRNTKKVVVCKGCDRTPTNCKCCIRPSKMTTKLNFDQLSKCASCFRDIQDGKKLCPDSNKCREFENKKHSSKIISDEILTFHYLHRNTKKTVVCKSCDRVPTNCKCCIRPSTLTSKLNLDQLSKCAGCFRDIQDGQKQCADSNKCRDVSFLASKGGADSILPTILEFHHLYGGFHHLLTQKCLQ